MKKHLLLLTTLSQLLPNLSATSYSWTGFYLKASPAYANLNLNYSGNSPYFKNLHRTNDLFPSAYRPSRTFKVAEKVSAHAANIDFNLGVSQEVSDCMGLIAEIGSSFGGTTNFIANQDAFMMQEYIAAGVFYHQPSFRISTMAGIGFGVDIFGYPNALEKLTNHQDIGAFRNGSFINATIGVTFRGSIGFDYKIDSTILLGVSYAYTRSKTTVKLDNDETFYISSHTVAATIGAHM